MLLGAGQGSRSWADVNAACAWPLLRCTRTAGSPLVFLRAAGFSWTHYWAKIFETSPIDCILLGIKNDIRHKKVFKRNILFFRVKVGKKIVEIWGPKNILKIISARKKVGEIFLLDYPSIIPSLNYDWKRLWGSVSAVPWWHFSWFLLRSSLDLYGDMAITAKPKTVDPQQ